VLAPHSTWRDAVVKYGRDETTAPPAPAAEKRGAKKKKTDVSAAEARVPSGPRTSLGAAIVKPVGARIDGASLLRHVYLEEVLACPCGGRRRIIDVEEPSAIEAILSHLGLPTTLAFAWAGAARTLGNQRHGRWLHRRSRARAGASLRCTPRHRQVQEGG
jgi:hypothetical protein